jgi:hypothetical protein
LDRREKSVLVEISNGAEYTCEMAFYRAPAAAVWLVSLVLKDGYNHGYTHCP